ncbi:MAG: sugar phosphate isomerase/epimerase [Parafilimonas sp.]
MKTRREFIKQTSFLTAAGLLGSNILKAAASSAGKKDVGIQLYSVRNEMLADAKGTLLKIGKIGYKEIESAKSDKGNYYGLAPKEIKSILNDNGMTLRSGHIHVDDDFQKSIDEAAETGQQYLISAVLPSQGQTVDNYKKSAEQLSKAGEQCKKSGLIFGYHNHNSEFDEVDGKILYDVLLENVDPKYVIMEMDLGWVINAGKNPLDYFKKYPGRFPLWHLKDMDPAKKHSTEFGKGNVDIAGMFKYAKESGMKYYFIEQEEYTNNAFESMTFDYNWLQKADIKG